MPGFEELFDFWDERGEGWNLLIIITFYNNNQCRQSTANAIARTKFLQWLIQSSGPDIKANYSSKNVSRLVRWGNSRITDAVRLLLELGPPGAIDDVAPREFHRGIKLEEWDKIEMLLALGVNPHRVHLNGHISPRAESPLSLAMYSSRAFWQFRDALYGINFDIEDFARQELQQGYPLLDAGWQMETLCSLLKLEFEPDIDVYAFSLICRGCCSAMGSMEVQPSWQGILESFKGGIPPQRFRSYFHDEQSSSGENDPAVPKEIPLTNAAEHNTLSYDPALPEDQAGQSDEESLTSESGVPKVVFDREEIWCIDCWYHFKETGRRPSPTVTETDSSDRDDSSEDDFSPFLFNT